MNEVDVLKLFADAQRIDVARGKKVVSFESPFAETEPLLKSVMGRSGNLRAPTIRKGKRFFVGFSAEGYQALLGLK